MEEQETHEAQQGATEVRQRYLRALRVIHEGLGFAQAEQVNEATMHLAMLDDAAGQEIEIAADPGLTEVRSLIHGARVLAEEGNAQGAAWTIERALLVVR